MHMRPRCISRILGVGVAGLVLALMVHSPAAAQGGAAPRGAERQIAPARTLTVPAATERTSEEMAEAEATQLLPRARVKPFRPMMDRGAYRAAKAAAAVGAPPRAPAAQRTTPLAPASLLRVNCNGVNEDGAGGLFPPDTHGAAGHTQFVQVVNTRLRDYTKVEETGTTCPTLLLDTSLAAFFNYFAETLFDPRVIYDHIWRRFVVTAAAFPEPDGTQFHFVGISQTADALGPYFVYALEVSPIASSFGGDIWEFPQLGMDQDAIIITANLFNSAAGDMFAGAAMVPLAKALVYNGLALPSVPMFGNFGELGTVAPPIVLDQNATTFLVIAPNNGMALKLISLRDSSRGLGATLTGPIDVNVNSYSIPPDAVQPGTSQLLDTIDNRFANASTQAGDDLFQVHTQGLGGLPTAVLYRIDTATNTALLQMQISAGNGSNDFNPSVAADTASPRDVYVT